jgi:hypothetical protein
MDKKILIIIKSHDKRYANYHNEIYEKIEATSRTYLSKKEEIDFVYIKANPNMNVNFLYEKENNNFWIRTQEDHWSSLKIKVLESLKYFLNVNDTNYDYVFITNLSTFINVDKLLEECDTLNEQNCGAVSGIYTFNNVRYSFPSGAGSIYSASLMKKILDYQEKINHSAYPTTDDIFFGKLLMELGINIKEIKRSNIVKNSDYDSNINSKEFKVVSHIRIKIDSNRGMEPEVHKNLCYLLYGYK